MSLQLEPQPCAWCSDHPRVIAVRRISIPEGFERRGQYPCPWYHEGDEFLRVPHRAHYGCPTCHRGVLP